MNKIKSFIKNKKIADVTKLINSIALIVIAFSGLYYVLTLEKVGSTESKEELESSGVNRQPISTAVLKSETINEEDLQSQESEDVSSETLNSFSESEKTVTCLTYFDTKRVVTESQCETIKQLNKRSKDLEKEKDKCFKAAEDIKDDCMKYSDSDKCLKEYGNNLDDCTNDFKSKLDNLWSN